MKHKTDNEKYEMQFSKKEGRKPGIVHFSNKVVFYYKFRHRCGDCGRSVRLLIAERNQSIRCFKCGTPIGDDWLCWFCENGISLRLLGNGDIPSCLLGKTSGWVRFCNDFVPGVAFGEDAKNDLGERRRKGEKIISRVDLKDCYYCKCWNTKDVIKTFFDGERTGIGHTPEAAFCEIGANGYTWLNPCRKFQLSDSPQVRNDLERQGRRIRNYFQALRIMEKTLRRT